MEGADEFVAVGHIACSKCGDWLLDTARTAHLGLCETCASAIATTAAEARLRYEVQGSVIESKPSALKPRKPSTKNPTPESRAHARRMATARAKAATRLQLIYRPMWELLLAEEKAKLGLEPKVTRYAPRLVEVPSSILDDIAASDERESQRARLRRGA